MTANLPSNITASGLLYIALASLPIIFFVVNSRTKLHPGFPTAGIDDKDGSLGSIEQARKQWAADAPAVIMKGIKQFAGCFQVITPTGPKIVLPGKFADEIRNDPRMNFQEAIHKQFFGSYPGFEVFAASNDIDLVAEVVRGRLTQSLNFITPDLAEETSKAVIDLCGRPQAWQECEFKTVLLRLVARVSSRVFVGPELCANDEWLDISVNYTVHSMAAANALGTWPAYLRPFVHRFLPEVRFIKAELSRGRKILGPIFQERRKANKLADAKGERRSKVADVIGWLDDAAKGKPYDETVAQMGLSLAAIHTTSELVCGIIGDLCDHPEWIGPLREEMVQSIKEHGWSKKALQNMVLTDSLMKESQRHHFGEIAAMHRIASEPIELSDGTRIPKGAYTMVSLDKMQDTSVFTTPSSYNPRRFLELRQKPGQENKWHFVTTGPEHLAFGHGKHSCPGRFFASNEVKVILIYLLVKFDWQWAAEARKMGTYTENGYSADPSAKAMIRERDAELPL
ncbi:Cytochrome P450 monooxygenase adrA [Paramyrothecium foliicola]|nr:Cytochrome P450 monooxygenase adrA [Paramyrothecium foliicola]